VRELNIGHFIIGEAVFLGLPETIALMRGAIARGIAQRAHSPHSMQQQQ
jgi:pyridoxine 5-phosphate synthase